MAVGAVREAAARAAPVEGAATGMAAAAPMVVAAATTVGAVAGAAGVWEAGSLAAVFGVLRYVASYALWMKSDAVIDEPPPVFAPECAMLLVKCFVRMVSP